MITSEVGIQHIKNCEGLRLNAYRCPAGIWTIGYGHTGNVQAGQTITKEAAENYLREDLKEFEKAVNQLVKVKLNQAQFDVLVSFTYNIGIGAFEKSTLLKLLNQGQYAEVPKQLMRWVHGNGKVLPGLVRRREIESKRWESK
jgi:lysozyme